MYRRLSLHPSVNAVYVETLIHGVSSLEKIHDDFGGVCDVSASIVMFGNEMENVKFVPE